MHSVNFEKSFKSIFEFLFVPVITGFFLSTLKGGPMFLTASSGMIKQDGVVSHFSGENFGPCPEHFRLPSGRECT